MYFTWKKSVFLSSALALSYAKKVKSTIVDSSIIHTFYKRLTKIRRGKDNFAQSNCAEYYFRQRDNDKRNENGNARLLAVKSFLVFLFSFSACFLHKRFSHNTLEYTMYDKPLTKSPCSSTSFMEKQGLF